MKALCLAAALSVAAAPPTDVATTVLQSSSRVDHYQGDMWKVVARIFNGLIPEDFAAFFARDPERRVPSEPEVIVAPADGIVLSLSTGTSRTIVISLGLTDVHVQRIPIPGRIVSMKTDGSGHLPTTMPQHFKNVSVVTVLETAIGPVEIRQITGLWTKRIQNFIKPGDEVVRGQRMGRILLGSTVTLTVPERAAFSVAQYDRVFGGETVIARY